LALSDLQPLDQSQDLSLLLFNQLSMEELSLLAHGLLLPKV
jgi:hypothetical protein